MLDTIICPSCVHCQYIPRPGYLRMTTRLGCCLSFNPIWRLSSSCSEIARLKLSSCRCDLTAQASMMGVLHSLSTISSGTVLCAIFVGVRYELAGKHGVRFGPGPSMIARGIFYGMLVVRGPESAIRSLICTCSALWGSGVVL